MAVIVAAVGLLGLAAAPPVAATPALTITTKSLPPAVVGASYDQSLTVTSGVAPYAWSLVAGALPVGLTLAGNGVISGTATTAGKQVGTFQVTDSATPAHTSSKTLSITAAKVAVRTSALPSGTAGGSYLATLVAAGGRAPYTWSTASAALPAGLTLSSAGVLSGTPSAAVVARLRVTTTDSSTPPQSGSRALTLTVAAAPPDTTAPAPVSGLALAGSSSGVALTWAASSSPDATALAVRRLDGHEAPTSPSSGVVVVDLSAASTSATDAAVLPGHWYSYAVFVTDGAGNVSAPATATIHTSPSGDRLNTGQSLVVGDTLWAPGGQYGVTVQSDGNLVEYGNGGAVWSTGTSGPDAELVMQGDGNLVLYRPGGVVLWSSSSSGASSFAAMQADGNFVVYRGDYTASWSDSARSDTLANQGALKTGWYLHSTSGRFRLSMQGDGNLVVTDNGTATWSSNTSGTGTTNVLTMQADGNLVVYQNSGSVALWSTGTGGGSAARLVMQEDGNLVVYLGGTATWSSKGGKPSSGGALGDDYPANLKNAGQDALVDPWQFYNRECTSFAAWRLNSHNGVGFTNYYRGVHWGDATNWGAAARAAGIAVNTTPAVGAIAWRSSGHVAWVAKVNSNGTIVTEDYNSDYHGTYAVHTVAASTFTGYIHIKDL